MSVVSGIMDLAAPFKCKRVKQVFHPWSLSPEALKARYLRDKSHRLALRLQSSDAWANYRHLRNKATTILRCCKADYFSTLADDMKQILSVSGNKFQLFLINLI